MMVFVNSTHESGHHVLGMLEFPEQPHWQPHIKSMAAVYSWVYPSMDQCGERTGCPLSNLTWKQVDQTLEAIGSFTDHLCGHRPQQSGWPHQRKENHPDHRQPENLHLVWVRPQVSCPSSTSRQQPGSARGTGQHIISHIKVKQPWVDNRPQRLPTTEDPGERNQLPSWCSPRAVLQEGPEPGHRSPTQRASPGDQGRPAGTFCPC